MNPRQPTELRADLRRTLLRLVLGVVGIDAVAIAVHVLAHAERWPSSRRILFAAVWTIATAAVVTVGLVRIRRLRTEARSRR